MIGAGAVEVAGGLLACVGGQGEIALKGVERALVGQRVLARRGAGKALVAGVLRHHGQVRLVVIEDALGRGRVDGKGGGYADKDQRKMERTLF
ncbi:hypothetical protein VW35_04005 [Devosia soli]|uniref:Uncharacterized protein n=1 Tax=Devosia soli TaxID=361041 RepID=A0A0F5LE51_9HYPH|nr:hypothetical protein VW35_04005 [Devosia soli]